MQEHDPVPLAATPRHPSPVDLTRFAAEAAQIRQIAQVLVQTDFVADAYRGRPDQATAAMLFGRELGIGPMASVQEIDVVQRRPTLSATAMRALAQRAGVVFEVLEASAEKVVMRARAPFDEAWTDSVWDLDRARRFGVLGKDNWKRQPQSMMQARCTTELCRLVAAATLLGLPYGEEELYDEGGEVAPEPEKKTRTVRRKTPAYEPTEQVQPEPEPEPKPDSYSTVDDEKRIHPEVLPERPDAMTANTRKALMASFNDLGVRARDERLKRINSVIGREVHSANQLTENEAREVIWSVRAELEAQGWPATAEVPE